MKYTREEVLEMLHNGVVMVQFIKTDGTQRTMRCTLCSDYIPKRQGLSEYVPRAVNFNAVSVWDIEKNEWRAFNLTTITNVTLL